MKRNMLNPFHTSVQRALGFIALGPLVGLSCLLAGACLFAGVGCVHASSAQADPAIKQPVPAFPNAAFIRGCTQEDAPAIEMYFTQSSYNGKGDPAPPFLHFEISASPTETFAPATLQLSAMGEPNHQPGRVVRAQYVTAAKSSVWLHGTVVLDELMPGDHVSGHYDVITPTGQRFQDTFRIHFTSSNAVCG